MALRTISNTSISETIADLPAITVQRSGAGAPFRAWASLPLSVAYDLLGIMAVAICAAIYGATQGDVPLMVYAFLAALILAVMALVAFIVTTMVLV